MRHLLEALLARKAPIGDEVIYRALLQRDDALLSVEVAGAAAGREAGTGLETAGVERTSMLPQPDHE